MDPIKEAFTKIKEDMLSLSSEISSLKQEIYSLRNSFVQRDTTFPSTTPTEISAKELQLPDISTDNPTLPQEMEGLKEQKTTTSTGNGGVPTGNQSNNQTHRQTAILDTFTSKYSLGPSIDTLQETLATLDSIKKDLRLKFKRLTPQEMLVFTTLYSLENRGLDEITYKVIATHISLSESSIRDYISRIRSKGIPIEKARLNNKKIVLSISQDFQKIASLPTIMKLREL